MSIYVGESYSTPRRSGSLYSHQLQRGSDMEAAVTSALVKLRI